MEGGGEVDGGEVAGNTFVSVSGVISSEGSEICTVDSEVDSSEGSETCTVDSEVKKSALSITLSELDSGFLMSSNEARFERGSAFDNVMSKSIFGSVV